MQREVWQYLQPMAILVVSSECKTCAVVQEQFEHYARDNDDFKYVVVSAKQFQIRPDQTPAIATALRLQTRAPVYFRSNFEIGADGLDGFMRARAAAMHAIVIAHDNGHRSFEAALALMPRFQDLNRRNNPNETSERLSVDSRLTRLFQNSSDTNKEIERLLELERKAGSER